MRQVGDQEGQLIAVSIVGSQFDRRVVAGDRRNRLSISDRVGIGADVDGYCCDMDSPESILRDKRKGIRADKTWFRLISYEWWGHHTWCRDEQVGDQEGQLIAVSIVGSQFDRRVVAGDRRNRLIISYWRRMY